MNNKTKFSLVLVVSLLVGLLILGNYLTHKPYETRVTIITPRGQPVIIDGEMYYGGAIEIYEDEKLVERIIGEATGELTDSWEMPLSEMTEQQKKLIKIK